jgi:hypothetical protein
MTLARFLVVAGLLSAAWPVAASTTRQQCEANFVVSGSFSAGRTYSTSAEVPDVEYLPALYRVRDKIAELGLEVLSVQERNGYLRAANRVRGGQGGGANAPLRGFVKPRDGGGVDVSLEFSIYGGQSTRESTAKKYLCDMIDAADAP